MASGVLHRSASLCLRPAAEPAAAGSGQGHGAVMIGDSRTQRGAALRLGGSSRRELLSVTMVARDHTVLTRQLLDFQHDTMDEAGAEHDPFVDLKARFMDLKHRNYVEIFSNYQSLAQQQTPKVCPTAVLGFQPGEAFTVRNVANLVPPYEHGGSETSAALEFAVNTLQESINSSLLNLLTYPWIEKRVSEGTLNLHGGYYNFVDCTFEKWTLLYREGLEGGSKYAIKNRSTWS
ncbi:unnamed protein product [Miscanthus lutarioriparius]|uniref:Carbonic anhydrase n=1 Tax=Miscanthus lutarioriparius TaxID=422564 RepID=A0A811NMT4_9POAL|nr:unnamed protein product [Miscanthus lutarioriparius]